MSITVDSMTGEQLLLLTVMGHPTEQGDVQRELHRRSLFGPSAIRQADRSAANLLPAARRSALLVA